MDSDGLSDNILCFIVRFATCCVCFGSTICAWFFGGDLLIVSILIGCVHITSVCLCVCIISLHSKRFQKYCVCALLIHDNNSKSKAHNNKYERRAQYNKKEFINSFNSTNNVNKDNFHSFNATKHHHHHRDRTMDCRQLHLSHSLRI